MKTITLNNGVEMPLQGLTALKCRCKVSGFFRLLRRIVRRPFEARLMSATA